LTAAFDCVNITDTIVNANEKGHHTLSSSRLCAVLIVAAREIRMVRLRLLGFLLLGLATFSITRPLQAQQKYTVTDLGTLPGGNASGANGINQAGHVVGSAYVQIENLNVPFPVLYERETARHNLGTLGGNGGGAAAINKAGQIVGSSHITGDTAFHAFLYDGTMHDLGTLPGQSDSVAYGINSAGQIVGNSSSNGLSRAFFYNGTMQDLGTLPGDSYATASAISDRSEVVGMSYSFVTSGGLGVRSVTPSFMTGLCTTWVRSLA
jgi:probable HAF family extracellular repeat protein